VQNRTLFLVTALVLAVLAILVEVRSRGGGPPPVPARVDLTPGVLNPSVTQANIASTICVSGWTSTIRPPSEYTSDLKVKQMREYGFGGTPADYQEDHLISLGLGGNPTDPRNLWPEPIKRALAVDKIEVDLHDRVCAGELTLAEAQRRESELKHTKG
jgi:hypothetical protein